MSEQVTVNLGTLIAFLVSLGAIVSSLIAIFRMRHDTRDRIMKEGQRKQEYEQLTKDVRELERDLSSLREKVARNDVDMAEVKRDLSYLVETTKEIKKTLDRIAPPTVKDGES